MDIGFIGLGSMGQAMVANLLRAGHTVRVWNRSAGPVDLAVSRGAQAVHTPREAFAGDAVCSMLADDVAVRAVVKPSLLAQATRGLVHVNFATISVQLAQQLVASHREHGLAYVAAPVFGRPDVAAAAKLNIAAAGDTAALDRVQPLFDAIGQKTWRFGDDARQANAVKLAGNFLIGTVIESLGEAMAMAGGYGVNAKALLELLTSTLFNAPVYQVYGGLIVQQRYDPPGFTARLGLKDIRLALEAAEAVHTPMPFASIVRDALLDAIAHGEGEHDWSSLAKVSYRRSGREQN